MKELLTENTPRVLSTLEACGYKIRFGRPGCFVIAPEPSVATQRFIEHCAPQIIDELLERMIDGLVT